MGASSPRFAAFCLAFALRDGERDIQRATNKQAKKPKPAKKGRHFVSGNASKNVFICPKKIGGIHKRAQMPAPRKNKTAPLHQTMISMKKSFRSGVESDAKSTCDCSFFLCH